MHSGSCLCGGVSFRVAGPLESIQICHCGQCRKAQGSAFASNIPVKTGDFTLLGGMDLLRAFESSPGKERVFCSRCGSPIFSRRTEHPEVIRLRAGLLDEPVPSRPIAHFYVSARSSWWPILDALPQFPLAYVRGQTLPSRPVGQKND
jgi:hypothetical protein